eukprot:5165337-Alexandrium_andersonii.AAC.1
MRRLCAHAAMCPVCLRPSAAEELCKMHHLVRVWARESLWGHHPLPSRAKHRSGWLRCAITSRGCCFVPDTLGGQCIAQS